MNSHKNTAFDLEKEDGRLFETHRDVQPDNNGGQGSDVGRGVEAGVDRLRGRVRITHPLHRWEGGGGCRLPLHR